MADFKPFTFDLDFTKTAYPPRKLTPEELLAIEAEKQTQAPSFSEEQLSQAKEQARDQGFEEGVAHGRAEAMQQIEANIENLMPSLIAEFKKLPKIIEGTHTQNISDMLQLVEFIFSKLYPTLAETHGYKDLLLIFEQTISRLVDDAKVVVKLHEQSLAYLKPKLEAIAKDQGFDGRLIIVPDAEINKADIRINWTGGFLVRTLEEIYAEAQSLIRRTLENLENEDPQSVRKITLSDPTTSHSTPAELPENPNTENPNTENQEKQIEP